MNSDTIQLARTQVECMVGSIAPLSCEGKGFVEYLPLHRARRGSGIIRDQNRLLGWHIQQIRFIVYNERHSSLLN
jgi:hypothetical protein